MSTASPFDPDMTESPATTGPAVTEDVITETVTIEASATKKRKKSATAKRGGRSSAATTQGWVPTTSAFDYLGNSYRLYRRRRVLLLAVVVLLAGLAVIAAGRVALTFVDRSSVEASLEDAQQLQVETSAQFSDLTGPSGIPVEQMLSSLDSRRSAALGVVTVAPDVSGLMSALSSVNIPGVVITGVDMSSTTTTKTPGKGATPSAAPSLAPTIDPSAAPVPSPSASQTQSVEATVTISGTFSDQQALQAFSDAVRAIPQLSNVDVKFRSGAPGTLTVTASLGTSATAGDLIEAELTVPQFAEPEPAPAPAPTGGN